GKTLIEQAGQIYFFKPGSNKVYVYNSVPALFKPLLELSLNGPWVSDRQLEECRLQAADALFYCQSSLFDNPELISNFDRVLKTKEQIFFQYNYQRKIQYAIFHLESGELEIYDKMENDMDG